MSLIKTKTGDNNRKSCKIGDLNNYNCKCRLYL